MADAEEQHEARAMLRVSDGEGVGCVVHGTRSCVGLCGFDSGKGEQLQGSEQRSYTRCLLPPDR